MRRINVRFYSIHVRSNGEVVDYAKFFEAIRDAHGLEIQVSADYTIVLDSIRAPQPHEIDMVLLGGDTGAQTVYYDRSEGGAVVEASSNRRWAAKPTRVSFDLRNEDRIVALESGRGGVTQVLLERYLERVRLSGFGERSVEITPLAAESFLDEIDEFERIRLASVEVSRPNLDWADHANKLYELADESDAQSSIAQVKAQRGESLNKRGGLVGVIRKVAGSGNSSIRDAKITGKKPGDASERTVSLTRHQERGSATVDQTESLSTQNDSLLESLRSLINTVRDRRNGAS